ncbi:unnamed protein product [Bemisia tabaci]|uniref:Peptidase S1 domain-containing protein n=1 Tax=Bemisia tabaci TaxID=7038 RepID=A0A9P0A2G8_BEMTA|nr:unnamed protein product [Bemisia tabaci]
MQILACRYGRVLFFIAAASQLVCADNGGLLSSLLGYPDTCVFRGHLHSCTFSLACWLVGGSLEGGCGRSKGQGSHGHMDLVTDWLFTCCIPAKPQIAPAPPPLPATPVRRDETSNFIDRVNSQVECGVPNYNFQKRIIGGDEALFGEFPWQAHIRIAGLQCGGVLVAHKYVATAAHCIHRARLKDIIVFLGELDTENTGQYWEPLPEEPFRIIKKFVHPKFQFKVSQPDRYDLALIKLAKPVRFQDNIIPICLPELGTSFYGASGVIAGWGKTDTKYGKTGTNILHKATVPILSDDECLQWHRQKNIHVELYTEMFCAGHSDGHMDACLGDSGSPLVVQDDLNGRWILAGITSAGFGCAVDHQPGIYHKVALTTNWILKILQEDP